MLRFLADPRTHFAATSAAVLVGLDYIYHPGTLDAMLKMYAGVPLPGTTIDAVRASILFLVLTAILAYCFIGLSENGARWERCAILSGDSVNTFNAVDKWHIEQGLTPTPMTYRRVLRWVVKGFIPHPPTMRTS